MLISALYSTIYVGLLGCILDVGFVGVLFQVLDVKCPVHDQKNLRLYPSQVLSVSN